MDAIKKVLLDYMFVVFFKIEMRCEITHWALSSRTYIESRVDVYSSCMSV